jgi:hypothetical protein
MAATRELFEGFKHKVGAWALMVSSRNIVKALEMEEYGLDVIDPPTSSCNLGDPGVPPFILYNDSEKIEKTYSALPVATIAMACCCPLRTFTSADLLIIPDPVSLPHRVTTRHWMF